MGVARHRTPFLALGGLALVTGIGGGLVRWGWPLPGAWPTGWHGPLLAGGFFGVVISLERAVALGRAWGYLAPLMAGASTLMLLAGAPRLAAVMQLGAALGLAGVTWVLHRRQPEPFIRLLALAALCWGAGTISWVWRGLPADGVPGWIGFLVLTIAAERLELTRLRPPPRHAQRLFWIAATAALAGVVLAPRLLGGAVAVLGLWGIVFDIARRTVRQPGLPRYTAVCLLAGYAWLVAGGTTVAAAGLAPGVAARDAALHMIFVGFVLSMVFGHAPIVLPAVLRVPLRYHPILWLPLAGLHATLVVRVAGGLLGLPAAARWGALGTAVALAGFIAALIGTALRSGRPPPHR